MSENAMAWLTSVVLRQTLRCHVRTDVEFLEGIEVDAAGLNQSVVVIHVAEAGLLPRHVNNV